MRIHYNLSYFILFVKYDITPVGLFSLLSSSCYSTKDQRLSFVIRRWSDGRRAILTVFTKWDLSDLRNKRLSTANVYLVDSRPVPPHILTRRLIHRLFEVFFAEVVQHRFSDALRPIVAY